MKIMHITSQATRDGPGNVLHNIIEGLSRYNYSQILISLHGKEDLLPNIEQNIEHFKNLNHDNPILDYIKLQDITKEILEFSPDIIHAHLIRSTLLMKVIGYIIKVPIVFTYHNMENHMVSNDVKSRLIRLLEKKLDRRKYFYTAVSKEVAKFLKVSYNINPKRVRYIGNFSNIRKTLNKTYNPPIGFFFLGRIHEQKNLYNIILAIDKKKKFMRDNKLDFKIFGEGDLELDLRSLVKSLKIEDIVEFAGFYSDFWEKDYSTRRIFVMSSKYEGMPMSLLEAVGNKIPVITNIVGDIGELLNKESAYIHSGTNPDELGAVMEQAIEEGEKAYQKSEKAAKTLSLKFSGNNIISSYVDFYRLARES